MEAGEEEEEEERDLITEGGRARRVPQSPHVPSVEQSREPPRVPNYARMSLQ